MIDPTLTKEGFEACLVGLPAEMVALAWWDEDYHVAYVKVRDDYRERAWTAHDVYRCMVKYIDWKYSTNIELSLKDLVEDTSLKMLTKLFKAEVKYGRNDAWRDDRWEGAWRHSMFHHLVKGDPTDVLIYAAFGMHHNWSTTGVVSDMVHARQELADLRVHSDSVSSYATAVMIKAYELLDLCRDGIANDPKAGPGGVGLVCAIDELLPLLHLKNVTVKGWLPFEGLAHPWGSNPYSPSNKVEVRYRDGTTAIVDIDSVDWHPGSIYPMRMNDIVAYREVY